MLDSANEYRTWAVDLAGFGDSQRMVNVSPVSVEDQTRFVLEFCDLAKIRPYAVIGHSMGGTIALKLALDHAERLDRLVLVCPVITGRFYPHQRIMLRLLHSWRSHRVNRPAYGFASRVWAGIQRASWVTPFASALDLHPEIIQRNVEDFQRSTWGAVYGGVTSLLDIGLEQRLGEVRKPTLVITGARDDTVPPSDSSLAANGIYNAQFVEMVSGRHNPHDEQPEYFNKIVHRFLAEPEPDASPR